MKYDELSDEELIEQIAMLYFKLSPSKQQAFLNTFSLIKEKRNDDAR